MAPGNLLDGVQDESLVLGSGPSCLNCDDVNYVFMYVCVTAQEGSLQPHSLGDLDMWRVEGQG